MQIELDEEMVDQLVRKSLIECYECCLDPKTTKALKRVISWYSTHEEYEAFLEDYTQE
jgi:hypothetical protein